jgi:hypothetical protein
MDDRCEFLGMRGVIIKVALAAALMGLATAGKPTAAFAGEHDGDWTVRVFTEQGNCDRTYSYQVRVSNGRIIYTSYTSVSLSGTISPQGEVMVNIRHFDEGAHGSGLLNRHTGIGDWRGAGKRGVCSGRWEAHRR